MACVCLLTQDSTSLATLHRFCNQSASASVGKTVDKLMHLIYDIHNTKFTVLFTVISYVRDACTGVENLHTFKTNEHALTVYLQRKAVVKQSPNTAYRKIIY